MNKIYILRENERNWSDDGEEYVENFALSYHAPKEGALREIPNILKVQTKELINDVASYGRSITLGYWRGDLDNLSKNELKITARDKSVRIVPVLFVEEVELKD